MSMRLSRPAGSAWLVGIATLLVMLFLATPIVVLIAVSFTAEQFAHFPPQGFSLKWYAALAHLPGLKEALVLSLELAALSTGICLLLAMPAAVALVRGGFRGKTLLMTLLLSPLLVPSVVTGLALLQFVNAIYLDSAFWALMIGHVVLVFPYVVRTIIASLEVFDWSLVETARVLGAKPMQAFRRVILPSIRPGMMSGAIFAFLTSFDNYTVSIFLSNASNRTVPVQLYNYIEEILDPSVIALCSALIFGSVAVLLLTERFVGLQRVK